MTTTQTPATVRANESPRQQFVDAFERETATSLKVLKAFPPEQSELRPHEKMKTARELAAMFTMEMATIDAAIRGTFTFPPKLPPMPKTWADVVDGFENTRSRTLEALREATDRSEEHTSEPQSPCNL